MFTVTTAEIRWFFPGRPDPGPREWLRSLDGTYEEQVPRDDLYLVFSGQEGLGIKLREGRIEFKKRLAVHRNYSNGPVTGKPETWIKWSIEAAEEVRKKDLERAGSGHWITINKKRFLQKYRIDPGGFLSIPPADHYPEKGLVVELSALSAKGTDWWTIGLECFGPADEVLALLLSGADRLLPVIPLPSLLPADSMGYPEWIGINFP